MDISKSKGFPKIDTNSIAPNFDEMKPAKPVKAVKTPKPRGFASEVFYKLATGSAQLGADIAAVPELVYETFSMPQNAIADYFDLPQLHTDSDKFKKTIGVKNAVKDYYKQEVAKLKEESAKVDEKYKYGVYDSFKNGNYKDGFSQLTNSFAESLPATASIMLGGAYAKTPQLLAASTMMFGAGKNEELKDFDPDMTTNARVINALGTGLAEGAFETIGSGSIGAAAKGIIEREGTKKAVTILKDGLVDFYKESLKKNPLITSIGGEGIEEWATQVTQNAIDVATGAKPQDYNVFTGGADAFIGGVFGGAVFGGGLKGLEKVANHQDKTTIKSNTKKVFELQKALENPDISETTQAEIHKSIDGLVKTNQELVQKNIDHAENLHPKVKEKLVESDAKIDDIKSKVKEIKLDNSITDSQKEILLEGLKNDFSAATRQKNDILEGKTTAVDVLPLKEQDKLKREALKELTAEQNPDGSKNITIDDQQITERANKNYLKQQENESNQDTSIAETGTQTEIQKPQAEAKKTSKEDLNAPAEDTITPNVEKPILNKKIDIEDSSNRKGLIPISELEDFIGEDRNGIAAMPNSRETIDKLKEDIAKNGFKEPIVLVYDKFSNDGEASIIEGNHRIIAAKELGFTEIPVRIEKGTLRSDESRKSDGMFPLNRKKIGNINDTRGVKGSDLGLTVRQPNENDYVNEKTPPTNTPIDGNLQSGTSDVGEVRATEPESPAKESVPGSIDGGENKGSVEIAKKAVTLPSLDDIADFINQTYLQDEQSKPTTETSSSNQGTTIESLVENSAELQGETTPKEKRLKISQKGKTPLANRKFKGDRAKANAVEPHDENSLVLQHFVSGGKISSDAVLEILNSESEVKAKNNSFNGIVTKKGKDIDALAHELWENNPKLSISKIKDAIIDIVTSHNTVQDITNTILKNNDVTNEQSPEYHLAAQEVYYQAQEILKSSDEEMQTYENALEQLTEAEIIELAENQDLAYDDFMKDLKTREVTFDFGPFQNETGIIQSDGSIHNEKGEIFQKESVTNVKQVNPEVQRSISKDNPELKEVNAKLEKANENLRIAKDALSRKAKSLDKELINDNEDIFGERKNQNNNKLFDERVDGSARAKATEKERKAVKDAQDEIKNLTDLKAKIESGEIKTTKEIYFAKIDQIANVIKKATKADIDPNDYDKNGFGFDQDKLIDLIAAAAKSLVSKGIDLQEAIAQVVDSLKAKFGDIDIDIDAVKERINPKEEKETVQPESNIDLEAFRDKAKAIPGSGVLKKFLSEGTMEKAHGVVGQEQNYDAIVLMESGKHGLELLEDAKKIFGPEYIEKTLSFIENGRLETHEKALLYITLENEMDRLTKEKPEDVGLQKLQTLVQNKSKINSRIGSLTINYGRLRNIMKNGFSEEEFTNAILTTQQIKNKAKIQQLSQVSPDDINAEAEQQENLVIDADTEKLIAEGVEKQINEIYKKLPTNRRIKADKAISALENIQKKLRGKAYDASIGVPIAIIDSGITIIKNSIKAGVNIADAIEIGINHIKSKYGKDWDKEDDFRKDMREGFEEEGVTVKDKAPKELSEEQKVKELVKKVLIDAGFSREITVRNKNGKEKRTVLDWKKLAGEAGSIDNIRKNVEEALKGSNYSKAQIEAMKETLEKEYVRLTADVIEKGLNELQNRNTERKPVNTKSAAKKLAELYNYGLFEKSKDSYEKIINSVLGFNELDQRAWNDMKQISEGYKTLLNSGFSEIATKDAINSLSRRQSRLVATFAFSQADWKFKLAVALSEITNLSTRFKLVNLGNLTENISSGMMARAANDMMDAIANGISGKKTSNKALQAQSKINAKAKLKGITFEASESYGDTSSLLLNHSAVEDYFNNATTNKKHHAVISTFMAKPVLEGADSYNKILITEAKMVRATIKVLEAKGMKNSEALDYVAKALTGESMQEALVKAKALIEKVNTDAGKKLLNNSEASVKSLAADIVKESLVSGGQISEAELKAIYNAAYKSAGKDIGHVSNNWVTDQISSKGAQIEKKVADAIKEKNWSVASGAVLNQILWKNFISTFVGGGTNWFVKGLQKTANPLSLISLRDDRMQLKMAGKLDVTTDEGIKNMEEVLYRGMNLRSTSATMLMGAIITSAIVGSIAATGADDDIDKWLKENPWAKKFFDKLVPDAVVLMLAIKNKDYGRYIAKTINVKADFFDDQKNSAKILENYAKGYAENDTVKMSKASGDLGAMLGKRFELPGPLRAAKDVNQIYKGVFKGEYNETNYYTSGFLNGFFQGGIVEGLGLRKDPDFQEKPKNKKKFNEDKDRGASIENKMESRMNR